MEAYRTEGWDTERRGSDLQSGNQFEYHAFPQTLDELELEFKIEAMELGRIRDKEEDEENYKHRKNIFLECCVDFFPLAHPYRANLYTLRLSLFMESHTSFRLFMGFLWCGLNVRDKCGLNVRDECVRYSNPMENYSSRLYDSYGEFQRQRREDFGKAYNRY
ncbi:hypothetical protein ES288_A12G022400v1 [Gossypium darwinii]|uniref:Uncharacterized protein n=1 Tax=Gossypium darwinii TaxID=34276 RepID=A0A5D2E600_GOSDA|nr:hypothetical protein ES288_A12G022400v1 [Gossypium darwinii]